MNNVNYEQGPAELDNQFPESKTKKLKINRGDKTEIFECFNSHTSGLRFITFDYHANFFYHFKGLFGLCSIIILV